MFMDNLNKEQELAVTTTEGHVRVIAGAGSGKTRALTSRYCYLVSELGIAPGSILCATFTNRAANEMRSRIRKELGDMDLAFICTFHAFCVQFLKEDINVLNYPKSFMLMDEEDVKSILLKIFDDMGLTSREMTVKRANDLIIETRKVKAVNYIDDIFLLNNEELKAKFENAATLEDAIFLRYLYEQKKCFGCDFNDLINFTVYILERFPEVREKWEDKMEYVMVDEFQDVSARQYRIAQILSGKHRNLFIVGDPDQTIYSWRGSHFRMFLDFDKDYDDAVTILLDTNYRSTPEILRASDVLISKNRVRYPKVLKAVRETGLRPLFFHAKGEKAEAEWIASRIQESVAEGGRLGDFAILYRAHNLSRSIEECLIAREIPYVIYSGIEFYGRAEIKDLICYLRMTVFADDISFRRTINVPPRRIGRKKMQFLTEYSETHGLSLYESLVANIDDDIFRSSGAAEYVRSIEEAKLYRDDPDLGGFLQRMMDMTGYEKFMRLQGDQERLDNMAELKRAIIEYGEDPDSTLADFLNRVALFTNTDKRDRRDSVRLMTVHTSKGMEFPYVFIIGLDEGVFPSSKVETADDMEEERRLMYVAMTRARDMLYLSDSEGVSNGTYKYPSRFIFDIGRENLDYVVELDSELAE
ncbi:MAG: UvrD-helicase domain-containing protein [archaeon]|nr:UvrD-helicase domain-containing protein [archaeon]